MDKDKLQELLETRAQADLELEKLRTPVTILFSDIANFTTMSEGLDSDELAFTMNQYFEMAVAQCIHKSEGTVAKYIGDAIFAFSTKGDTFEDARGDSRRKIDFATENGANSGHDFP